MEIYTSANFAHDKCSMPHFVDVKKVCVRMMKCYTHQQIVACVKVAVYAMIKKEVSQSFKCDFSLLMQRCQALSQFRSDRRELISSSQSEFKGGPGWSYIGQLTIFGHFLY